MHGENAEVLKGVITDHEDVCRITYRSCCVEQVVVKTTVKVTPLEKGDFCKPEIDCALKAISCIGCVFVCLSTLKESCSIGLREVFVPRVKVIAEMVLKLFWRELLLLKVDRFSVVTQDRPSNY